MVLKYITTLQFAKALGLRNSVPSRDVGNEPTNEAVGTGDGSSTFYLDQKNIISGTYTLYANAVGMTETTHYSLDLETGKITLTADGITMLSTNALTGQYDYFNNGMSDSYLEEVLGRAEKEVENVCNTIFIDTSSDNPDYILETEIQSSEGIFQDRITTEKKPLIDIATTLDGDHDISQDTVDLTAGTGSDYPSSGSIIVGSEVMSYTGISTDQLTGITRGAMGTTAATHSDGDDVHTTILFRSDTTEGTAVSWDIQPWDTSMNATEEGVIYKFADADPDFLTRRGVANRIKILYYYGYNSLPTDITRLNLIFGKRMLSQDNISAAMIKGRNEFRPEMFNADLGEMKRIINSYSVISMGNT